MVPTMWGHALPHLRKGMATASNVSWEELVSDLMSDKAMLWGVFDGKEFAASFISSVYRDEKTNKDFLGLYALGGSGLNDWLYDLVSEMKKRARQMGCERIMFAGREAWGRVHPTFKPVGRMGADALYEVKA
jgi:hypothetical protein